MKKLIVLSVFAATSILLTHCAPKASKSVSSTTSGMSDEAKIEEIKKNYTEEQLVKGKDLFMGSCDNCHKLKLPETHTISQWEGILPRMTKRAKMTDEQAGMVRAWVLLGAKHG